MTLLACCGLAASAFGTEFPEVVFPGHGNIGADFNVARQPDTCWRIDRVRADVFDHCYKPGSKATLAIHFAAGTNEAVSLSGQWHWVWLGDAAADESGGVRYVVEALESSEPFTVRLDPDAPSTAVELRRSLPDRTGLLGLFLEVGDGERTTVRWVTNLTLLHPVAVGTRPDSPFFGELRGVRDWQRALELPTLAKLGVKWVRIGFALDGIMPAPGRWEWADFDARVALLRDHAMLAMLLPFNAPQWMRSYGRLDWPNPGNSHKQDLTPSPDHLGDWVAFFEKAIGRSKDVVRAVNVWNEPWEGGGITDWGGTGAHFRQLARTAHLGVARADASVLVGGNDSDANIVDNLFCDPHWNEYVSLLTIHTHGGFAGGMIGWRKPADTPLWNTEMWYTAQSDRTVQWQVMEMARGCGKVNLAMLGNFFTAGYKAGGYFDPKDRDNVPDLVPHPNAMAYNAMTHRLEGMRFVRELSPAHRPYLLLFERVASAEADAIEADGACVVLFGQSVDAADQADWQANPGPNGQTRLSSFAGLTGVYDRYGRPMEPDAQGHYTLPLTTAPVYLTASSATAFDALAARLVPLTFERPLHLSVDHPTVRPVAGANFGLSVLNATSSELPVTLTLAGAEGWAYALAGEETNGPVSVSPGQTRNVGVRVVRVGPLPDGSTPLTLTARTPLGEQSWTEPLTFRVIPRHTPTLGAGAEAWEAAGVPLVVVRSAGRNTDLDAAMPWEAALAQPGGSDAGRYGLAYDEQALYLLAQIRSPLRDRPWDQSRDDWYELHPGGYAYRRAPRWPFTGRQVQLALDVRPNPEDALFTSDDPRARRYPSMRTDYLFGFYETEQGHPQAWRYRQPGAPWHHRYPFSPPHALDQGIPHGVRVATSHDAATDTTTIEAVIPWALLPEVGPTPGRRIEGLEVKLVTSRWSGLYSSAGMGASQRDSWIFQPHWIADPGFASGWRMGE